jgi:L-amino acid N-acyltransferase YncA
MKILRDQMLIWNNMDRDNETKINSPTRREIVIRPVKDADRGAVIQIFNHYAASSFAAYPEGQLPDSMYDRLKEGAISFIVAETEGKVIGFGLLRPFMPFAVFRATAAASYFIGTEYTRRGVGTRILERLETRAKEAGITNLVVHISSKNESSIRFHQRQGFTEAGRLQSVGKKFGEPFDIVWMQKTLS